MLILKVRHPCSPTGMEIVQMSIDSGVAVGMLNINGLAVTDRADPYSANKSIGCRKNRIAGLPVATFDVDARMKVV